MTDDKMTSVRIAKLLQNRHSGESWAFFDELRTCTGYIHRHGYIDCYAVGLWNENRGFIAYEIKISRNDFKNDILNFNEKQGDALKNSSQFYYVCPQNLIDQSEVPETCGLMWVDAGGIKVKKVAPIRELNSIELDFASGLLRASSGKKESSPVWKYLGKELTEGDLLKLAKETSDYRKEREIQDEVEKRTKEANASVKSVAALERIAKALNETSWRREVWDEETIVNICEDIGKAEKKCRMAECLGRNIKEVQRLSDSLAKLVNIDNSNDAVPERP